MGNYEPVKRTKLFVHFVILLLLHCILGPGYVHTTNIVNLPIGLVCTVHSCVGRKDDMHM